ncbi:MAG: hypothetical protein RR959_08935 [Erysipelotrichaceae bacterium]
MAVVDTTLINLLGKTVSFVYSFKRIDFELKGVVTDICFSLSGDCQISLDEGDFYRYTEVTNFVVYD